MTPPRTLFRLGQVETRRRALIERGLKAGEPAAMAPLVAIAATFQAVGRWTAKEWAALTPEERRACAEARKQESARDARRLAALIGLAVCRPGQAEEFAAEFDGGALREAAAVESALEEFEQVAKSAPRGGS